MTAVPIQIKSILNSSDSVNTDKRNLETKERTATDNIYSPQTEDQISVHDNNIYDIIKKN